MNQIAALNDSLTGLRNLRELIVSNNQLTSLPSAITKLTNLQVTRLFSRLVCAAGDGGWGDLPPVWGPSPPSPPPPSSVPRSPSISS